MDARTSLTNRFRTALKQLDAALTLLDDSERLEDATLAQIVPLLENAANIAQTSVEQLVPGYFLPLLREPRQGLVTEATAPMHPHLPSSGQILANASRLNQTSAWPSTDAVLAVNDQVRLATAGARPITGAEEPSQLGLSEMSQQPGTRYSKSSSLCHNTQTAGPGTPQNPIGSSARSRPY